MNRPAGLSTWCAEHLGAAIDEVLWQTGHLSSVVGARLDDGRLVVVKARPWAASLPGCHAVHEHVRRAGFPCPEPLTGPMLFDGDVAVSAEVFLGGGEPGRGDDPTLAVRTARELARLTGMTPQPNAVPSLAPPRAWAGWSDPRARPWPPPDEGAPLNELAATEPIRPLAAALSERLTARAGRQDLPDVVSHIDWYQGNLRWAGEELVAADDWDSIVAMPDAAVAGCAAASFRTGTPGVHPDTWPGAEVDDTAEFLHHYAEARRGAPFSADELEVAWAAGLWQRVFDAAKALALGRVQDATDQLRDARTRARLAGLGSQHAVERLIPGGLRAGGVE